MSPADGERCHELRRPRGRLLMTCNAPQPHFPDDDPIRQRRRIQRQFFEETETELHRLRMILRLIAETSESKSTIQVWAWNAVKD